MQFSKSHYLLIFLLAAIFAVPNASAQDRAGDTINWVTDLDNQYPNCGDFDPVDWNYNDQEDDCFNFQDWPIYWDSQDENWEINVNEFDAGDYQITAYYDNPENYCHLGIFENDPSSSEDMKLLFNEGTHIQHEDGEWPDKDSSWEVQDYRLDSEGQAGSGPGDAYAKLVNEGMNGQSFNGKNDRAELIDGSDWQLVGDLLCADHQSGSDYGGSDMEWQTCTSDRDGNTVTVNGDDYVCDGNDRDWFVNNQPNAAFTVSESVNDGQLSVGESLTFDASNSGRGSDTAQHDSLTEYRWDWDDDGNYEDTTSSDSISHTFSTAEQKDITLEVEDEWGKTDTVTQQISIDDNCLYGDNAGTGSTRLLSSYIDYGDDVSYDISHNDAGRCPSESEMAFNVCDHSLGERFITKTNDKYEISFNVPTDVPCSWGAIFPSDDNTSHRVNITWDDGTNIPHSDSFLNVYAKGEVADPHSGYYIYIEQSVQNDPNNLSGMWLSNQTWYDCDGGCGLTSQNTYPDNGSANSRNVGKGAKFLIEQEDENKPDGTQHEAGVWHAEYGAVIENATGAAISNYASEPANEERDGNCGNSECWWLGNNYQNLTAVYEQQFATDLKESFTDAAKVY